MKDFLLHQSVVSAAGYSLVLGFLALSLWHWVRFNHLRRLLGVWGEDFETRFEAIAEGDADPDQLAANAHPVAQAARRVLKNPSLTPERMPDLLEVETARFLLPLRNAAGGTRGLAVCAGFLGTLLGILMGAVAYGEAGGGDQAAMLQSIGLSMLTTLIGAIAAEIESRNLRFLDRLECDLTLDTPELVGQLAWAGHARRAALAARALREDIVLATAG